MKRYLGVVAAAALAGTVAVATDAMAAGHRGGLGSGHSTLFVGRPGSVQPAARRRRHDDGRAIGAMAN
jgi:hypothetical protein